MLVSLCVYDCTCSLHIHIDSPRYSDEESQFPGPPENEPAYVFVLLEYMTPPFPNNYEDLLTKLRMSIPVSAHILYVSSDA